MFSAYGDRVWVLGDIYFLKVDSWLFMHSLQIFVSACNFTKNCSTSSKTFKKIPDMTYGIEIQECIYRPVDNMHPWCPMLTKHDKLIYVIISLQKMNKIFSAEIMFWYFHHFKIMHACPWLPWLLDVIQWSIEAGQTSETQYYYLQYTYVQY